MGCGSSASTQKLVVESSSSLPNETILPSPTDSQDSAADPTSTLPSETIVPPPPNSPEAVAKLQAQAVTTNTSTDQVPDSSHFAELKNLDNYQLLWLDKDVNSTDDNRETARKLRAVISHLVVFDDLKKCEKHIKDVNKYRKIVLIVSGSYGRVLVPRLKNESKVISVYVYCSNEEANREWAKEHEKVNNVVTEFEGLLSQLRRDQRSMEETDENSSGINVYSRETDGSASVPEQRDKRNASFMCFLLFIDILLKMPKNDVKAKKELIEEWDKRCEGNEFEKAIVKEFDESYSPENSVWWYTRESLLYRLLNKALRESDQDTLFGLRFFLTDLYQQLADEHPQFIEAQSEEDPILYVFRGQLISKDEMNLINESEGDFITFNSFLSTSLKKSVVLQGSFLKPVDPKGKLTRVLFEIEIDTRLEDTKPYADIAKLSCIPGEAEILIMLGSIFEVEEVKFNDAEQLWVTKLRLCDESSYELNDLLKEMKVHTISSFASLGRLLLHQGEYVKAKQFYQELLNDETLSDSERGYCYGGLGQVATEMKEYDEALVHFQQWLQMEQTPDGGHLRGGLAYFQIGQIYWKKQELDTALFYLKKALEILILLNDPQQSAVYIVMADCYDSECDFSLRNQCYMKALEIMRQNLPPNHYNFGIIYNNLAFSYVKQADYKNAREYYKMAYGIFLKSLPPNHPHISRVEKDIRRAEELLTLYPPMSTDGDI